MSRSVVTTKTRSHSSTSNSATSKRKKRF